MKSRANNRPRGGVYDFEQAVYGGDLMRRIKLGANFAIFVLFFGVATLEAFQTQNWLKAAFWLAIGLVFLAADSVKKSE